MSNCAVLCWPCMEGGDMMATIPSRLKRLREQLDCAGAGLITVTFKNGDVRHLTGGEYIGVVMNAADTVVRFEGKGDSNGALLDLLNGLSD